MKIISQKFLFYCLLLMLFITNSGTKAQAQNLPGDLSQYIKDVKASSIHKTVPKIKVKKFNDHLYHVSVSWSLQKPATINDMDIIVTPSFSPSFHWAPLLAPDSNHVIAQHVFRSPAMIIASPSKVLSIIPDLDLIQEDQPAPLYMDLNASQNQLVLGMANTTVKEHVLFTRMPGISLPAGKIEMAFYCIISDAQNDVQNPFQRTASFLWNKWGSPLYQKGEPLQRTDLEPYVKQTYDWAFHNWKKVVWQEFEINGKKVGAPVFIVKVTQSPNYPGEVNEREFRSIWNQAWFNSLRSAQGLFRYAKRTHNDTLLQYAIKTKELALAFPQQNGFFKSVIATEMEEIEIDGKKYNRSKGWDTHYFGNSNRNPFTWNPRQSPYHIADMSFTAYWMLVWYDELEKDERLLNYAKNYADALMELQDADGFYPAWLSLDELKPLDPLSQSPETSISVSFLLKLFRHTGDKRYLASATKAMHAVMQKIVPIGQWEDFETYWSCSRVGSEDWVGKKIARNNMFKQNTLSIYWTAQALLEMYKITKEKEYLSEGQRVLDELLMWQAVWQPPYIAVHSLGGFGVMNGDAEWNDSRQSLFAGLIIDYGMMFKREDYIQRGLAALHASFTMMYTPLNPATMKQWQARWPFFKETDYGFMMENYGHDGITNAQGLGIGEFTIYDWGNGAAAEAYNRIYDQFGKKILERDPKANGRGDDKNIGDEKDR